MKKFLDWIYNKLGYTTPKTYTQSKLEYCPLDFDEDTRIYIPSNLCHKKGIETLLNYLRRTHAHYDTTASELEGTHFIEQDSYRVLLAVKRKELDETPIEKKD